MKTTRFGKKRNSNYKKLSRLLLDGKKRKFTKQRGGSNNTRARRQTLTKRTLPIKIETNNERRKREREARKIGAESLKIFSNYSNTEKQEINIMKKMDEHNMKIIEVSSLYLGVAYFAKALQIGFSINIFNLHVDLLQYIINNRFLSEYQKPIPQKNSLNTIYEDNNTYLCINNLPCLTCKISPFITYKAANNPLNKDKQFYNVYEPSLDEINNNPRIYKPPLTQEECYSNYANVDGQKTSYECIVYESTTEGPKEKKSLQDIEYVRLIAEYLSATIEEQKQLKCDFSDIPEEYVIKDTSIIIEGVEYLICGYPEPKSMKEYLHVLQQKHNQSIDESSVELKSQEILIKDEIDIIHEDHKTHFSEYMAKMYNSIPEYNENQIKDTATELYKFNSNNRDFYLKNMISINKQYELSNDPEFDNKYSEMRKLFNNSILSEYFNKPMMDIKYNFLVFKKLEGKYIPAFYNFKKLVKKHLLILNKIQELITKQIPEKFKIITKGEEYKLFFSYHPYGDFFHIRTEYLHTMSNIFNFSYKYKNILSLEELIYILERNENLNNLRVDYQLKSSRLKQPDELKITNQTKLKQKIYCNVAPQSNLNIKQEPLVSLKQKPLKQEPLVSLDFLINKYTKILLMYKDIGDKHTIIYKSGVDNKFYILKIESNLCNIIYHIIDLILKKYIENNTININYMQDYIIASNLPIFKIVNHSILSIKNFNSKYNPLTITKLEKLYTQNIKLSQLINSPILNIEIMKNITQNYDMQIKNPYQYKPIPLLNILNTKTYINEFTKFKKNFSINKSSIYREGEDDIINEHSSPYYLLEENNEICIINHIYFNPEGCGYNFIELYSGKAKKVIWIIPIYSSSSIYINEYHDKFKEIFKIDMLENYKYLCNFMDLNNNHLKMLLALKNIYLINNYECSLNIQSIDPMTQCLHFHLYEKEKYNSDIINNNIGSRLYSFLSLIKIINNLYFNKSYYNEYNININTLLY